MDISSEKLYLIQQLLQVHDARVIAQIRELLMNSPNPIVGYHPNGMPITQKEFIEQIEQAEKEYKSGNYQTIDEFEKESESW